MTDHEALGEIALMLMELIYVIDPHKQQPELKNTRTKLNEVLGEFYQQWLREHPPQGGP